MEKQANKIILVKIIVGQRVLWYLSGYAPQCGCSDAVKYVVNDLLSDMTSLIPPSEFLIPYGDWSGHKAKQTPFIKKYMKAISMAYKCDFFLSHQFKYVFNDGIKVCFCGPMMSVGCRRSVSQHFYLTYLLLNY